MDSDKRDKNRNTNSGRDDSNARPAQAPKRAPRGVIRPALEPETAASRTARPAGDSASERASRAEERLVQAERRIEWLESRNINDDVTGLLNRRGLDDALSRALARARRYGETGTLLLLEPLCYEKVFEERGAAAADYVLAAIGAILQRQFREVDYVARLDAGRFAALLLQMGAEDARRRAAMLRDRLAAVAVPWDGEDISIRIRTGISIYSRNETAEEVFERAEAELEERQQRIARLRKPGS